MTVKAFPLCIFLIPVFLINCGGGLAVRQAMIQPEQASAGDDVIFYVTLAGNPKDVGSVRGIVREYSDNSYDLHDDGENGDENEGDNIWSHRTAVPWRATEGTYHIEIRVLDKKGKEIVTKGFESQTFGSGGVVTLKVK